MAAETRPLLLSHHHVALGDAGGDDHNTIVLSGIDLVIPLELDMDGDPFQDDQVRLASEHGHYEQILLSSDPDVEPAQDSRWLHYRFRDVPPGAYRLAVRIGGEWSPVLRGIVITREGAFASGKKLGEALPATPPAEPDRAESEDSLPNPPDGDPCEH